MRLVWVASARCALCGQTIDEWAGPFSQRYVGLRWSKWVHLPRTHGGRRQPTHVATPRESTVIER